MSRTAIVLATLTTTAALLTAAPAEAASTVGQTFSPSDPGSCNGTYLEVFQTGRADGTSYAVPGNGVLVAWSFMSAYADTTLTLRVFRQVAAPDQYLVVGDGGPKQTVPAGSGLHTYPTRVPVRAGDIVGISGSSGMCGTVGVAGDTARYRNMLGSGVPVGGTAGYTTAPGPVKYDIAATWEPDADGDGYGDETQDACPASALSQAACPAPETRIKGKVDRTAAKTRLKLRSTIPGSTYTCALDKKKAKPCKAKVTFTCLPAGKHKLRVTATSPAGIADPTPAKRRFTLDHDRRGC